MSDDRIHFELTEHQSRVLLAELPPDWWTLENGQAVLGQRAKLVAWALTQEMDLETSIQAASLLGEVSGLD